MEKTAGKTRTTQQQRIILDYLQQVRSHPTADEIYVAVRRVLPRVSLGTVYRNLGKLDEAGAIQSLEHAGGQRRYDGNPEPHVHARCESCGRVVDAVLPEPCRGVLENVAQSADCDLSVSAYRFELIGECPECSR